MKIFLIILIALTWVQGFLLDASEKIGFFKMIISLILLILVVIYFGL